MRESREMEKIMENHLLEQRHNQIIFDEYESQGPVCLGPYSSFTWRHDPKHFMFTLARYKFCSKMLAGKKKVIEIGCGDGIGVSLLLQSVHSVYGVDLEKAIIESNVQRFKSNSRATFGQIDITKNFIEGKFDAAVSLDVIEHIPQQKEHDYMNNICLCLRPESVCIVGTPNVTSNSYASKNSSDGHINLKDHDSLSKTLSDFFQNVFIFSMNDEIVHTGFYPMAHYLIGIGVGLKEER